MRPRQTDSPPLSPTTVPTIREALQSRQPHFLAGLFLTALFVRVAVVGVFHYRSPGFVFPDSAQYDTVAANVLDGKGFILRDERKAQRPPAYPLFMILCGRNLLAIRLAQASAGALSCVLLVMLCRELFGSESAARLCGMGLAFEPFNIFFTRLVLTETLHTTLMLAMMLMLARALKSSSFKAAAGGGCLIGLAILVKPAMLLMPPFLLPFFVAFQAKRKSIELWAVCCLCTVLVLSPWIIRNYIVLNAFIPTTTQGGESLWESNNPRADGGPMMDQEYWPEGTDKLPEVERDKAMSAAAKKFIIENPGRFVKLCLIRCIRFWNVLLNFEQYRTPLYNTISILATVPLYLLAIAGLFIGWRKSWHTTILCLVPIAYTAGLHLVFVGSVRYRIPIIPYLLCFAGVALAHWFRLETSDPEKSGHKSSETNTE